MAFVCTCMLLAYNGYHDTYSAMSQIIKMDADFHQNLSSCGNFEKVFFSQILHIDTTLFRVLCSILHLWSQWGAN